MAARVYDYVVLGAGVQGLFTAHQLRNLEPEAKTLVLEQFDLGHARGSSHGASRIIRKAYVKRHYAQMMEESYSMWESLSREAGIKLITPTGLLMLGSPDDPRLQIAGTLLRQTPSKDQAVRVPSLNPHASYGLWDPNGGILLADKALKALLVIQLDVCYWREKEPGQHSMENGFPCIMHLSPNGDEKSIYALPPIDYPHLFKLCCHFGIEIHPDTKERQHNAQFLAFLSAYVKKHLPGLESTPALIDSCLYTNTPDMDFIIDKHPRYDNIIIGAGFSGHGFKLAPVVGKLLAELASGRRQSYKLTPFRISRFALKANL
uniref:Pipecolic acid oxidase n=1 Tax=Eptatretus burgeri TaxID=7764 RepID=A0A8C4R0X4_EPTBU